MRTISGFRVGPLPHGRKRRRVSLSPARRPDEYQRMTGTGAEREAAAEAARRGPLRVVFVAHAFPRGEHDPTGHFLLGLAGALAAEGVEVEALAPAAPGLAARERPAGAAALAGLLAAGTWALRRAAAGADLVHAHWWFPGGLQALAAGRRPLVTTVHGTDVRLARSRPLARAACARVLRASAVVTAVSRWLADEVAGFAPDCADRVRVAPMPVDETLFTPGDERRDELLFVGRLDEQKGLDTALRALPRLRGRAAELPLRIVGGGPAEARLRRLADELGIAGRLLWEARLPQAELAARYRRAAALLVPGRDEGLGLVAVEGQLAGAPVVAAASGGLVDVVRDGGSGRTCAAGEPAALARAVEEVVADPTGAQRLAEAARRSAVARFGTRAAARAYADAYAEALATGRR